MDSLRAWIGKTCARTDCITAAPVAALAATLDRDDPLPQPGDPLPPFWHHLFVLPICKTSETGPDGHLRRGGFLPPVPLPRRMFAGAKLQFHHPLRIGDRIAQASRIVDVTQKSGRSGPLVFVVVRHEVSNDDGLAIVEEQDLVYRENALPGAPPPPAQSATRDAAWTREIRPNSVLLFRYSALTFAAHKIHYDWRYTTEVEGYPGLVVHGPLIATLLLELFRQNAPRAKISGFSFRAVAPLFDAAPFQVCGRMVDNRTAGLWAVSPEGALAMDASVTFS